MDPNWSCSLLDFHAPISCKFAGVCGGCPWIEKPLSEQHEEKLNGLKGLFPKEKVKVLSPGQQRLRDRVDLTIKEGSDRVMMVGLWSLSASRELVDLDSCPMMSPALEEWFLEFRSRLPRVKIGSVRLRVAPDGTKGVWLDFSNEDVKDLFTNQREYLKWLLERSVVEIGQKNKRLYFDDSEGEERPRLHKEVQTHSWFQTWDLEGRPYSVEGVIGGFSQSGLQANRVLVKEVIEQVAQTLSVFKISNWVEAFCGSGNFTYPLASQTEKLVAFENDPVAISSLGEGLKAQKMDHVEILRADLKSKRQMDQVLERLPGEEDYGLLVDPPRSGMMRLKSLIQEGTLMPKVIVYISCFTKSLLEDAEVLESTGYKLSYLSLVDQFPHSPHVEWVSVWSKV